MFLSEAAVTALPATLRSARNRTGKLQRILLVFCLEKSQMKMGNMLQGKACITSLCIQS